MNTLKEEEVKTYDYNPFVEDKLLTTLGGRKNVYLRRTTPTALINETTGEIDPADMLIVKKIQADKETFIKLYSSHLKAFFELTGSTFKFLHYVLNEVSKKQVINTGKVYLSYSSAKQFYDDYNITIAKRSYFYAIKEMLQKNFIAKTKDLYIYYFNVNIFFNGDRVSYLTEFQIERNTAYTKKLQDTIY